MNINHKLTETNIKNIDVKYQLEHQNQIQETKASGWIVDKTKTNWMKKKSFYKTSELKRSNYVRIPLRSNAVLNIENSDKYCFLWSISA